MVIDLNQTLKDSFRVLKIISNDEDIDLNNIDFVTPFIITPLSAYLKANNKIKTIKHNKANIQSYLDFISFPKGITVNDFIQLNKTKNLLYL